MTIGTESDGRVVHQESVNYQIGYAQGFEGRRFFCPSSGNPIAEMDHAWGYEHGENDARLAREA
jgi:hypothetical protein